MRMTKVGINGYGTIGRRVADAVKKQPDMELVGVTKVRPDYRAKLAQDKGIPLYSPDEKTLQSFKEAGYSPRGTLEDLLERVDVIVEATPDEVGAANKRLYEHAGVKAIFEGGEEHSLIGCSFVAQCNYDEAIGKKMVRVVSCNATALCRVLGSIDRRFGILKARVVIARRAGDPHETSKGPIDSVVLDPPAIPSHHAPDVLTVLPNLNLVTMAYKVPTTHMHIQSVIATLKKKATKEEVVATLDRSPRIMTVTSQAGYKSTANVIDWAREMGRPRNDIFEAVVWSDPIGIVDDELFLFIATHQEAIVIPENIDAIRAVCGGYSREESMKLTDESLGIVHR
jgi:glyceraldehyde-3-phosphate dehydrogenase (NAD(P))